jgi:hypothetical protein
MTTMSPLGPLTAPVGPPAPGPGGSLAGRALATRSVAALASTTFRWKVFRLTALLHTETRLGLVIERGNTPVPEAFVVTEAVGSSDR